LPNVSCALNEFLDHFGEFDYGINLIEGLYNTSPDGQPPDGILNEKFECHRKIILFVKTLLDGALGAMLELSIFHPEDFYFGYALIALRASSVVLSGIDQCFKHSARRYSFNFLRVANPDVTATIPDFPDLCIDGDAMKQLSKIVPSIMSGIEQSQLTADESNMFSRLSALHTEIYKPNLLSKCLRYGGKISAFVLGNAAGIAIVGTGQDSPQSYYLTLASGTVDPMLDTIFSAMDENPVMQKYLRTCELLYLCKKFAPYDEVC
jgi:hypothetical protein